MKIKELLKIKIQLESVKDSNQADKSFGRLSSLSVAGSVLRAG